MQRLQALIERANIITNPLLPDNQRLQAAVEHTEPLYDLGSAEPQEAKALIEEFGQQAKRFMMVATDPSEDSWVRRYVMNFTLKLGFTHLAKAAEQQSAHQGPGSFSASMLPVADLARRNIDLPSMMSELLISFSDEKELSEVREASLELYILAQAYLKNGFAIELDPDELITDILNDDDPASPFPRQPKAP